MGVFDRIFGRNKQLAQPDYGTAQSVPNEPPSDFTEIAAELPISLDALAGGMPVWEDPVLDLDAEAYVKMRRCLPILKGHRKLAIRTAKLNWTVVGPKEPKQPPMPPMPGQLEPKPEQAKPQTRAEAVAEIFGQIRGWTDFVYHCTGSLYEGMRPYQIKTLPAEQAQSELWIPDLFMGGRHRYEAGGDIRWDGGWRPDSLRQVLRANGQATREPRNLPIDHFALHRPGPGSSPNGYLDVGVALYNAVVKPWSRGIISGDLWVRLFAIPAILAGAKTDKVRPDRIAAMLQAKAQQIQASMAAPGSVTALNNDQVVNLLQADPSGLTGMVAWQQYLEALVDDLMTLAALTSSSGLSQANRTGNTAEQKDNEDEAAFINGVQIAETFNRHILPRILMKNDGEIPERKEGEQEVYLWPCDPHESDEQDVTVSSEGVYELQGQPGQPDDAKDAENTAQMFADMQARAYQARGGKASVALAAVSPLPPVH